MNVEVISVQHICSRSPTCDIAPLLAMTQPPSLGHVYWLSWTGGISIRGINEL